MIQAGPIKVFSETSVGTSVSKSHEEDSGLGGDTTRHLVPQERACLWRKSKWTKHISKNKKKKCLDKTICSLLTSQSHESRDSCPCFHQPQVWKVLFNLFKRINYPQVWEQNWHLALQPLERKVYHIPQSGRGGNYFLPWDKRQEKKKSY